MDEQDAPQSPEQPGLEASAAPAPRERRSPRTLAEKLEELASSARARLDKLRARELRLVQDLGKVRAELQSARAELDKISGARPAPFGSGLREAEVAQAAANGQATDNAPF